jgi:hypothetical protein
MVGNAAFADLSSLYSQYFTVIFPACWHAFVAPYSSACNHLTAI